MPSKQAGEHRPHEAEQVGHADEIAHDVVAVEPDEWQELVERRRLGKNDEDEQRAKPGQDVRPGRDDDEDSVEIDPAQVAAQSPASVQPVGVREVGVEGWKREIDADAHDSG